MTKRQEYYKQKVYATRQVFAQMRVNTIKLATPHLIINKETNEFITEFDERTKEMLKLIDEQEEKELKKILKEVENDETLKLKN